MPFRRWVTVLPEPLALAQERLWYGCYPDRMLVCAVDGSHEENEARGLDLRNDNEGIASRSSRFTLEVAVQKALCKTKALAGRHSQVGCEEQPTWEAQ